jgi:hypothetical protein
VDFFVAVGYSVDLSECQHAARERFAVAVFDGDDGPVVAADSSLFVRWVGSALGDVEE